VTPGAVLLARVRVAADAGAGELLVELADERIKAAPLRGTAGPASAAGSALGRPARRTPGHMLAGHADQGGSHVAQIRYSTQPCSSPAIVQLAVTASMAALPGRRTRSANADH